MANQFLEVVINVPLVINVPFKCKPTNPEPTPPTTCSIGCHTLGHHLPAVITIGPGTRQIETTFPEPAEITENSCS